MKTQLHASKLPLTPSDWQATLQAVRQTYAAARRNQPPVEFFSTSRSRYEGHVILVGKGAEPLFLILVALGPLASDSLDEFFMTQVFGFLELRSHGPTPTENSWCAIGMLPAAKALSPDEKKNMLAKIGAVIDELTEKCAAQHRLN